MANPHFDTNSRGLSLSWAVSVLGLAAANIVTGLAGLAMPSEGSQITLVWAPTGISLAALFMGGRNYWPGVWIGAFFVNLWVSSSVFVAGLIATGNTLEAVAGAFLLATRWGNLNPRFERQRDVLTFVAFGAMVSTVVSATIGCLTLCAAELIPWGNFGKSWVTWWLGNATGALIVAPPLMIAYAGGFRELLGRKDLSALLACHAGIVFLFLLAFKTSIGVVGVATPLIFLSSPLLLWVGFRFGGMSASLSNLFLAVIVVCATLLRTGPFSHRDDLVTLFSLWAYLSTNTVVSLLLMSLLAERKETEGQLHASERHFRLLVENAFEGVTCYDRECRIIYVSPSNIRIDGRTSDETIGINGFQLVHPDYVAIAKSAFAELLADPSKLVTIELLVSHKNGSWIWVEATGKNCLGDGVINGIVVNWRDITIRKTHEIASRAADSRIRGFLENSAVVAWMKDDQGRHVFQSENYQKRFPTQRQDWLGKTDRELWSPEVAESFRRNDLEVLHANRSLEEIEEMTNPDGSSSWWLVTKFIYRDESGQKYVGGLAVDITVQRRAEMDLRRLHSELESRVQERTAQLREANEHLQINNAELKVLSHVGATCSAAVNADDLLGSVTASISELLGLGNCGFVLLDVDRRILIPHSSFVYRGPLADRSNIPIDKGIIGQVARTAASRRINDVRQEPDYWAADPLTRSELCVPMKIGARVLGVFNAESQELGAFSVAEEQILGTVLDLVANTLERIRSSEMLAANEVRLRAILDAEPECVKVVGPDGSLLDMNPAGLAMIEAESLDQVRGRSILDIISPKYREAYAQNIAQVIQGEQTRSEFEIRGLSGTRRWMEQTAVPVSICWPAIPNAVQMLAVSRDVTERKLIEQSLAENEERLRLLMDSVPAYISYVNAEERYVWVNQVYEGWYGRPRGEILGKTLRELQGETTYQVMQPHVCQALRGETVRYEHRLQQADGMACVFDTHYIPHKSSGNEVLGFFVLVFDVTKEHAAAAALRASEERYRKLFTNCADAIFLIDMAGHIRSANESAARMHGYSVEELVTMNIRDLDAPDDAQFVPERLTQFQAGESLTFQVKHRRKDETIFPLEVVASPVRLGEEDFVLAFDRDISERVNAEISLRESRELLRNIIDASESFIYLLDVDGKFLLLNRRLEEFFQVGPNEPIGKTREGFMPDAVVEQHRENDLRVLRADKPMTFEETAILGERTRTYFTVKFPLRNSRGQVYAVGGISTDITERKEAEHALRLTQFSIDRAVDSVFWINPAAEIIYVNDAACRTLGYSREELIGKTVFFIDPNFSREVWPAHWEELRQRKSFTFESDQATKSGAVINTEVTVNHLTFEGREYNCAMVRDITERKQAEAHQRLMKLSIEGTSEFVFWIASDGRIVFANEAACRHLERTYHEVVGMRVADFDPDFPQETWPDHWRDLKKTGASRFETRHRTKSGKIRFVEVHANFHAHDGAEFIFGFARDISERKQVEENLRKSLVEKQALLKEVHHRVKNNLQIVTSLLNLQAAKISDPEAIRVFSESQNRVRAMALVHETLYRSDNLGLVNLPDYLHGLCSYLLRAFEVDQDRIRIDTSFTTAQIDLDRAIPCGLIVNELVSNALKHAFPNDRSGCVRIALDRIGENDYRLTVADNGIGILSESDRRRGSLGLQLVSDLALQLGANLVCERTGGTAFYVTFPVAERG